MSVYYINPIIKIIPNKFENIMNNLINNISNLFMNNKDLIIEINYQESTQSIINILIKYLKIYKFYEYNIKYINLQIYNKTIDVIINIKVNISKSYFSYSISTWKEFYFGILINIPVVYNAMSYIQQQELNTSIINGKLYFNNNIELFELNNKTGMILKKELCSCEINNCNSSFNYIITIFW